MAVRGIARLCSPSLFGIGAVALVLVAYSSGTAGVVLFMLIGFPAMVGGLVIYFEYGWRRAVVAAAATLMVMFVVGTIDAGLGPGRTSGGGGMPPRAGAR